MARHKLYPESVRPGMPKMPRLPPGWRAVPFGELLSPVYRPAELDDEVTYQLVTAKRSRGGIVPREALNGAEIKTKTQFYVQGGDFLISRRQIIHGACGFVPEALSGAVVSGEYDVLAVGPALLPEYLEAFTHTTYFQQSCFQSSVGVDIEKMVFDLDHWFTYPMPLPPLEEQARIAGVLGRIKAALRANERALEQARRVKKALLSRLLSEGIGHTRFKETEIGRVPEGWEVCCLATRAESQAGGTPDRADANLFGGTIPWVKSAEVNNYRVRSTEESLSDLGLAQSAAKLVPPGSTLVAMYGATAGAVAKLEIEAATNQAVLAMWPRDERLLGEFLFVVAQRYVPTLIPLAQGSGQPNLNGQMIRMLKVPVPPRPEQAVIASLVHKSQMTVEALACSVKSMSAVYRGSLDKLLAGPA